MRARSLVLPLVLAAACSGGGGDVPTDAATDAAAIDAVAIDVPAVDAPRPDAADAGFDPLACGTGTDVVPLPASGTASGTVLASTPGNVSSTTCNGRGAETAYLIDVAQPVTLDASTDEPATTLDTVLYLRRACQDPATELACNDDVAAGDPRSHLVAPLTPGRYYLIVDGRNVGSAGDYHLTVHLYVGRGQPCSGPADCAPGDTCRAVPPATQATCEAPVCADGRDDDGDGHVDYPADPGCAAPTDDSEADACPAGAGCPACADGVDNDGDGLVDYPADPSCPAASGGSEESCRGETEPMLPITAATTTGTTVGATDGLAPTCAASSTAPDRVHTLVVPYPLATLTLDTDGSPFDTVLSLFDQACTASLACDDDSGAGNQSRLTRTGVAAGTYRVAIDGFGAAAGAYTLHVAGTYPAGGACDPTVPYLACPGGSACSGPSGAAHCAPAACSDGLDGDGDGLVDYPADPGCATPDDDDEADPCPGAGCPACADGLDNDGDGLVDYPADPQCAAASGASERACASEADPIGDVAMAATTGTTVGASNDFTPTCGAGGAPTAPDRVLLLTLGVPVASLTIDTVGSGYDTILSMAEVACAPVLACNDDTGGLGTRSRIVRTAVAPGTYAIIVDGFGAASGAFTVNVTGTLPAGGACADPLVAAGVLACPTGQTCQAGTCAP